MDNTFACDFDFQTSYVQCFFLLSIFGKSMKLRIELLVIQIRSEAWTIKFDSISFVSFLLNRFKKENAFNKEIKK